MQLEPVLELKEFVAYGDIKAYDMYIGGQWCGSRMTKQACEEFYRWNLSLSSQIQKC